MATKTTKTTKTTSTPKAVTTQGTKTAAGVVNYNPNTGARLKAGESVTVNAGGNTYGSNISRSYDSKHTSGSPANPQINAEVVGTKPMNVPPPPVGENYMGTLLGANTGLANQALGTTTDKNGIVTTTPIEPTAQADGGLGDIYKQYQELSNTLQKDAPSAESIYNKSLKESGLRQYQQEAQNYSSQINAITAKAQADILSTTGQGRGIPEAIIGGQQAQISKEAAIQALPLQALLANAQGNVELAQSHLDTLFKIRFEDAKTKHEYKTKLLDSAMQVASKQEQRQYEAIQKADDRKYSETQKLNDTQNELLKNAVQQKAPQSIVNAINSAKSTQEAIKAAGQYGATAQTDIVKLDNGNTVLINRITGATIRNLGGSGTATPGIVQQTVNGAPVDGYKLSAGDDPYFIAQKYGTDMAGLKALNPKITDWNNIQVGATINVPSKSAGRTQALQTILASGKFTKEQKADLVDAINNGQDPFAVIKNQAKNVMGQTLATDLDKAETAKQQLESIDKAIKAYYAAGGQTGIFTGNYEKTLNKLGNTTDPKLVGLTTEIALAMQAYRLAVTGTAASVQEDARIDNVFPGISSGQILNNARTQATIGSFNTKIDAAYRNTLGSAYDQLKSTSTPPIDPLTAIQTVDKQNPQLIDTIYRAMPNATTEEVYQYLKSKGYVN